MARPDIRVALRSHSDFYGHAVQKAFELKRERTKLAAGRKSAARARAAGATRS